MAEARIPADLLEAASQISHAGGDAPLRRNFCRQGIARGIRGVDDRPAARPSGLDLCAWRRADQLGTRQEVRFDALRLQAHRRGARQQRFHARYTSRSARRGSWTHRRCVSHRGRRAVSTRTRRRGPANRARVIERAAPDSLDRAPAAPQRLRQRDPCLATASPAGYRRALRGDRRRRRRGILAAAGRGARRGQPHPSARPREL